MSRTRVLMMSAALALSLSTAASAQSAVPAPSGPGSALPADSCQPSASASGAPVSPGGSMPAVAGSSAGPAPVGSPTTAAPCVAAQLLEMAIPLAVTEVAAGSVTFDVANVGTVEHEFAIIPTDLPADGLPVKDGVVDETQVAVVARTGLIAPGASETLSVDLPAGHYVIICNVPGHYLAGMRTELTVR